MRGLKINIIMPLSGSKIEHFNPELSLEEMRPFSSRSFINMNKKLNGEKRKLGNKNSEGT